MIEPVTTRAIERTWRLSGAIYVGLVLLLLFIGGLVLDFKERQELLLPYYLTAFQRSQLLILLLAPVQFAVAAYAAIRIAKLHGVADLLRSIDWNPSGNVAVSAFVGVAFAGVIKAISVRVFGTAATPYDGYAPLSVSLFLLSTVLAQPFIEEFYFRGILFIALADNVGDVGAVLVTSLLFAAFHPLQRLAILPVALVLGVARMKTKSVAACFALHAGYNLGVLIFNFFYWRQILLS
ncbi:MAG: CPBP family intramembrane glutamic endopeptidase [Terriglobales bacterium]